MVGKKTMGTGSYSRKITRHESDSLAHQMGEGSRERAPRERGEGQVVRPSDKSLGLKRRQVARTPEAAERGENHINTN
jgi:hypothetical protein